MSAISSSNGKILPVAEHFYTLQGEGVHTGKAAWFVRLGGCDICCNWCDARFTWEENPEWQMEVDKLIDMISENPSKSVVVTGGEPLMYNLDYLCAKLKEKGFSTFLETSGSFPLSGQWDWICLSPKKHNPPIGDMYKIANELKVVIHDNNDFGWAEDCASKVSESCQLLLQPEWSSYKKIIHEITEYIKRYPFWRVSLQAHKFMRIP